MACIRSELSGSASVARSFARHPLAPDDANSESGGVCARRATRSRSSPLIRLLYAARSDARIWEGTRSVSDTAWRIPSRMGDWGGNRSHTPPTIASSSFWPRRESMSARIWPRALKQIRSSFNDSKTLERQSRRKLIESPSETSTVSLSSAPNHSTNTPLRWGGHSSNRRFTNAQGGSREHKM